MSSDTAESRSRKRFQRSFRQKLARARAKKRARSGGSSDPTGGTQFVFDPATGKTSIVKTTKENLEAIEAGRKRELDIRAVERTVRRTGTPARFSRGSKGQLVITEPGGKRTQVFVSNGRVDSVTESRGSKPLSPVLPGVDPVRVVEAETQRRGQRTQEPLTDRESEFERLSERPFGEFQRQTISEELASRPQATTIKEAVARRQSFAQFEKEQLIPISPRDSGSDRIRIGTSNFLKSAGFGFGTAVQTVKERPFTSVAVGGAFLVTGGLAGGALKGIGLSATASKAIVGGVGTGVFVGAKAITDPRSVTTPLGLVSTTTEFGTFAVGLKGMDFIARKGFGKPVNPKEITLDKSEFRSTSGRGTLGQSSFLRRGRLGALFRSKKGGVRGGKRRVSKAELRKKSLRQKSDPRQFFDVQTKEVGRRFRSPELKATGIKERIVREKPSQLELSIEETTKPVTNKRFLTTRGLIDTRGKPLRGIEKTKRTLVIKVDPFKRTSVTDVGRGARGGREALVSRDTGKSLIQDAPKSGKRPKETQRVAGFLRGARDVEAGKVKFVLVSKKGIQFQPPKRSPIKKQLGGSGLLLRQKPQAKATFEKPKAPVTGTAPAPPRERLRGGFRPGMRERLFGRLQAKRRDFVIVEQSPIEPSVNLPEMLGIKGVARFRSSQRGVQTFRPTIRTGAREGTRLIDDSTLRLTGRSDSQFRTRPSLKPASATLLGIDSESATSTTTTQLLGQRQAQRQRQRTSTLFGTPSSFFLTFSRPRPSRQPRPDRFRFPTTGTPFEPFRDVPRRPPTTTRTPPDTPPPVVTGGLIFPDTSEITRRRRRTRRGDPQFRFRYTPSVEAIFLGVRGKKPNDFRTGLNIRPMLEA